MQTIRATVDTNNLAAHELDQLARWAYGLPIVFDHVSVSDREMESYRPQPPTGGIQETAVWAESYWGEAEWGDELSSNNLEEILAIVAGGSFPRVGRREGLTDGYRRELRDSMIFLAHVREQRDLFISDDKKAFVGKNEAKRRELESRFSTRILTRYEFRAYCEELRGRPA